MEGNAYEVRSTIPRSSLFFPTNDPKHAGMRLWKANEAVRPWDLDYDLGCAPKEPAPRALPKTIGEHVEAALTCAERRASGIEKPIPMPWRSLAPQFGGGLWPGLHILVAGTGAGKSAWSLQLAVCAAKAGCPVLYIALELDENQLTQRAIANEMRRFMWSRLATGKATEEELREARAVSGNLVGLPLHIDTGTPQGWPASELRTMADGMRALYPEENGPGSRPFLVVLDFLQIVGPENGNHRDELRERIGRAAYAARDIAKTLGAAVLVISSAARDKYGLLAGAGKEAGFVSEVDLTDPKGKVVTKRHILRPDILVGLGKESGEIEYAADSVTVAVKWPVDPLIGKSVIFATAKGRATGAGWTELRFTGSMFEEPDDGGAWLASAISQSAEPPPKKSKAKEHAPTVVGLVAKTSAYEGLS